MLVLFILKSVLEEIGVKNIKWSFVLILVLTLGVFYTGGKIIPEFEDTAVISEAIQSDMVIPGGIPIGIYLDTNGVMVIDTETIISIDEEDIAPAANIIEEGDYIIAINNMEISTKQELIEIVSELDGSEIIMTLRRDDEEIEVALTPVLSESGSYMLGIWVRDNLQGLGTLTYVDTNSDFGALGHGINDIDTGELLEISDGELYKASISGIIKGESGSPGGLEGVIIYNPFNLLGTIEMNTNVGIYGSVENIEELELEMEPVEVATIDEIEVGSATILCTINDEVGEYEIEITKVDLNATEENKGLVIQVTDEELLEKTGGIVQGMSGAPILQNGKIVGAVTHVFVNDPTRGYGIFVESMLETAESINN